MDVTKHAIERARDRLSWGPGTVARMADRAWQLGVAPSDVSGRLKKFIDGKLNSPVGS